MLDRIDSEILALLQKNARLSNKELATSIGLAPSTCLERVKRLRDEGVLAGDHAEVNPESLGIGLQAMVAVRLQQHSREVFESFNSHALGLPGVIAVYHLAGANDFLVHVAIRDADHLRAMVLDDFTTRPEVEHLETALIFGYQRNAVLPNYRRPA